MMAPQTSASYHVVLNQVLPTQVSQIQILWLLLYAMKTFDKIANIGLLSHMQI